MNQPQVYRGMLILWIALASMGRVAFPQTAQITGRITDSSGAVVPDAEVEVVNVGTGIKQGAGSNGEGYYTVPLLQPGEYKMIVQKSGFKTITRSNITLAVGRIERIPTLSPSPTTCQPAAEHPIR